MRERAVRVARRKVDKLLNKKCTDYLTGLVFGALQQATKAGKDPTLDATLRDSAASLVGGLANALDQAQPIYADKSNAAKDMALANPGNNSITYYPDFFATERQSTVVSGVGPISGKDYKERNVTELAQTLIHEGLHLIAPGLTDAVLGRVINNGKPLPGNAEEQRKKGSTLLNEKIKAHCKE